MTAPMLMTDCPTPEALAEFVDGTLDDLTRRKVTEHVSNCGDCREYVNLASDFKATDNVKPFPIRKITTAAALAAAAVLAIFVLRPDFIYGPDMNDVIRAARSQERRPSDGRLARFPYLEEPAVNRGDGEKEAGEATLWTIADEAKDPHIEGVARLHNAIDTKYYATAIEKLREAYAKAPAGERDDIAIDLAAALLSRWAREPQYREALSLSDEVLRRTRRPEAAWNRAAALEALGEYEQALKAFAAYRELDPNSEWTKEAQEREADIRELMSYTPPPKR